jgi:hypothetical protein
VRHQVQRYEAVKGGPQYLACYELESVAVMQTPAFTNRPRTPWGQKVSPCDDPGKDRRAAASLRNRWFADSLLEGGIRSEPVSEIQVYSGRFWRGIS